MSFFFKDTEQHYVQYEHMMFHSSFLNLHLNLHLGRKSMGLTFIKAGWNKVSGVAGQIVVD